MNYRKKLFSYVILASLIALTTLSTGWCKVVYVKTTGDDTKDGLSWATAEKTVTAGIATAVSGDEVWVAEGTYVGALTLKTEVGLYGGFSGVETDRTQRDYRANVTTIDASKSTGVTVGSDAGPSTVVDGFAIVNTSDTAIGPTVGSATISNNTAIGGCLTTSGGAITGNTVSRCSYTGIVCTTGLVSGNTVTNCNRGGISTRSGTVVGNIVRANSSTNSSYGGGITCTDAATVANNFIIGNGAVNMGIVYCCCYSLTPAVITNNTLVGNSGAAIYSDKTPPIVANNIIAFNTRGVDKYMTAASPVLRNNCVYNPDGWNYGSGVTADSSNISSDPRLVCTAFGIVHIRPDSPCIDAGSDVDVVPGWTDIDAQRRISGAHVDIGADECDGTMIDYSPQIVHVSPHGNDANDGSSWALAKKTVQAAVNAATSGGGEVWVAAGLYAERVTVPAYVRLYGGFLGTEMEKSQRDYRNNATVLDAGKSGTVVTFTAGHRCSTLDGFHIRNGYTSAIDGAGGISCGTASPAVVSNSIYWNSASCGGIAAGEGTLIVGNKIWANTASSKGGGISCGFATVANNVIFGNGCLGDGGGIWVSGGGSLINNTIACNAGQGVCTYGSPVLSNNIIAYNSSGIQCWQTGLLLRNNCVYNPSGINYAGIAAGMGDICIDPKLAAVQYGRAHLQPGSPCIDAGSDTDVVVGLPDFDGQTRILGSHVDIGADESDGSSWPADPVVIRVSPYGNDANDGLSWSSAKKTVQGGVAAASTEGGEVWVAAGTYVEQVTVPSSVYLYGGFSGAESNKAERNWQGNTCTIDGNRISNVVTFAGGHLCSAIDGFTIRNSASGGAAINGGQSGPIVANNTVTASGLGIAAGVGNVLENTVSNNSGQGITCNGTISGNTVCANGNTGITTSGGVVARNVVKDNLNAGISATAATVVDNVVAGSNIGIVTLKTSTVSNNTVVGSSKGIYTQNGTAIIANNIVAFSSIGIYRFSGTVTLRYNCVYNPGGTNYSGTTAGTGDKSIDPKLLAPQYGRVHLLAGSPCIDAGSDSDVVSGWTDIDGMARVVGVHVDIGADEYYPMITFQGAKTTANDLPIELKQAAVTASFPNCFYIESDDRSSGIRVEKTAHGIVKGVRADVVGIAAVNADGERCIAATSATAGGTVAVSPLGMNNSSIGGGKLGYQDAVWGWQSALDAQSRPIRIWQQMAGLNNIGLLIRTCGKATRIDDSNFTIDDGEGDNIECVLPAGVTFDSSWNNVIVTGICSCKKDGTQLRPRILIRSIIDVSPM